MTGWSEVYQVAGMDLRQFPDTIEPVPHVTGLIQERDCGCYAVVGMRLDKMEGTFGAGACADHETVVQRTLVAYGSVEDSDVEVLALWRDMLDAAIDD